MKKLIRIILAATMVAVRTAGAEEPSKLIDKKVDPKSPEAIYARSNLYNPDLTKLAYRATVHQAWKEWAHDEFRTDQERTAAVAAEDRETLRIVNGESYRNGWLEAFAKDAVDGANTLLESRRIHLPVNTLDHAIEKALDQAALNPKNVDMDPDAVAAITASVFHAFQDPNDPNHDEAVALVHDSFPNLKPGQSLEFQPQVSEQRRADSLTYQYEQLIRQGKDTQEFLEKNRKELIAEIVLENGDVLDMISEMKKKMDDQQAQAERLQKFQDASGILTELGETARLLGMDDNDIYRIDQSAKLVTLLGESDKLSGAFSENPLAYTNVYLAIVVTVANIINGEQKDRANAAMMGAMQRISEQIEELRKEILARFDALDEKLDRYFEVSLTDLSNIQNVAIQSRDLLVDSLKASEALDRTVRDGINFLWENQFVKDLSRCLGTDKNAAPFSLSEADALTCRNSYALIMSTDWDLSQLTDDSSASQETQLGKEYGDLRNELAAKGLASKSANDGNPSTWMLGARLFLSFFKLHPEQIGLAMDPHVSVDHRAFDADKLELDSMIQRGQDFIAGLRDLALHPLPDRYTLKMNVFDYLLQQYAEDIKSAFTLAQQRVDEVSGNGPKANQDLNKQTPANMKIWLGKFVSTPLQYCGILEGKKDPVSSYYKLPPGLAAFWSVSPTSTKLLPEVASILPNSVLWMYKENFGGDLIPCVRDWSIQHYQQASSYVGFAEYVIHFEIMQMLPNKPDGTPNTKTIVSFDLDAWTAHSQVGQDYFPWSNWGGHWAYFAKDVNTYYHLLPDPAAQENLDKLVKLYERQITAQRDKAGENLAVEIQAQTHHAKEKLQLALTLGIDQRNPLVRDIVGRLISDELLPDPAYLAGADYHGTIPEDELAKDMQARIAVAQKLIQELGDRKDLLPRSDEIDDLVQRLEELKT